MVGTVQVCGWNLIQKSEIMDETCSYAIEFSSYALWLEPVAIARRCETMFGTCRYATYCVYTYVVGARI